MRIRQCVLDGEVQSHRNLQCLMGSGKGGFCHRFCLIAYMDDLSVNLKECQTGCIASSSSSNTVQGSVLLPHYRTLEVRPGRIS